jgi:hypothetical protein
MYGSGRHIVLSFNDVTQKNPGHHKRPAGFIFCVHRQRLRQNKNIFFFEKIPPRAGQEDIAEIKRKPTDAGHRRRKKFEKNFHAGIVAATRDA